MVSKEHIDRIVEAIEGVSTELADDSQIRFETESYNMLAFIGENLWEIQNTLKKIEAKMK
jgi:environmental stress-induced protein Ves